MEGVGESALDVLSRAATMLQEQSPIRITNDEPKQSLNNKQLPTAKWKRDRRNNRTEYTRKTDHKSSPINGRESPTNHCTDIDDTEPTTNGDAPLDMSVRYRGLPPTYNQAISDPSFRSSYKSVVSPSGGDVITPPPPPSKVVSAPQPQSVRNVNGSSTSGGNVRDDLPSGISMCDQIIDEHFRRSLGKAYMTVFNNNNNNNVSNQQQSVKDSVGSSTRASPSPTLMSIPTSNAHTQQQSKTKVSNSDSREETLTVANRTRQVVTTTNVTTVNDLMDDGGLSVDDHFAKALGDTWLKLNGKKEASAGAPVVENANVNSMLSI